MTPSNLHKELLWLPLIYTRNCCAVTRDLGVDSRAVGGRGEAVQPQVQCLLWCSSGRTRVCVAGVNNTGDIVILCELELGHYITNNILTVGHQRHDLILSQQALHFTCLYIKLIVKISK